MDALSVIKLSTRDLMLKGIPRYASITPFLMQHIVKDGSGRLTDGDIGNGTCELHDGLLYWTWTDASQFFSGFPEQECAFCSSERIYVFPFRTTTWVIRRGNPQAFPIHNGLEGASIFPFLTLQNKFCTRICDRKPVSDAADWRGYYSFRIILHGAWIVQNAGEN